MGARRARVCFTRVLPIHANMNVEPYVYTCGRAYPLHAYVCRQDTGSWVAKRSSQCPCMVFPVPTHDAHSSVQQLHGSNLEWSNVHGARFCTRIPCRLQWTGEEGGAMYTGSGRLQPEQWTREAGSIRYTGSGRLQQWTGEAAGVSRYTGSGRLQQWPEEAGGVRYTGSGRISGNGESAAARSQTPSSLPSTKMSFGTAGAGSGAAAGSKSLGHHPNEALAAKVRAQLEDASTEFVAEWRASHGINSYSSGGSSSSSSAQKVRDGLWAISHEGSGSGAKRHGCWPGRSGLSRQGGRGAGGNACPWPLTYC